MTPALDPFALFTGLIGGLALFLFGMDIMTQALKQVAGDHMRTLLARMTGNRFVGVAAGATITAIIQSSSITTVLLVGFISAGLMSTSQSVAVVLGANIGTTVTAQILAFKVTKIALPMLAVGFFVSFLTKREEWRQIGFIILGLGTVFLGMNIMSDAMAPLRSYQPFLDFMASLDNPLLAAVVGAGFTAIVQSSSATTGILIVMAGQGLVDLESAIALALGANVGTCVTAALAALGKPREAVRTAVVHTLFNVSGVVLWIGLVDQLADLARYISPQHPELSGLDRTAAEIPRQLANIHTFFNVANTALCLGITSQIARLAEKLVPDRPLTDEAFQAPVHIDDHLLDTPTIALDATRRELAVLGGMVRDMLSSTIPIATSGTRLQLRKLQDMDRAVDARHRDVVGYLRRLSLKALTGDQSDQLIGLLKIANDMEHIGDQIARDVVTSAGKRIEENVQISKPTEAAIGRLHDKVLVAFDQVLVSLEKGDAAWAVEVRAMKKDLARTIEDIARHEAERLQADEPKRLLTYTREVELIEILDDIFKTTRRIARTQIAILAHDATTSLNS